MEFCASCNKDDHKNPHSANVPSEHCSSCTLLRKGVIRLPTSKYKEKNHGAKRQASPERSEHLLQAASSGGPGTHPLQPFLLTLPAPSVRDIMGQNHRVTPLLEHPKETRNSGKEHCDQESPPDHPSRFSVACVLSPRQSLLLVPEYSDTVQVEQSWVCVGHRDPQRGPTASWHMGKLEHLLTFRLEKRLKNRP